MPFAGASRASIQGMARLELAKDLSPPFDYAYSSPAKQAFGVDLPIAPPSWQSVLCHSSVSNCFNSTRRFAQGFAPRGAKPLLASEKDTPYRPCSSPCLKINFTPVHNGTDAGLGAM